MVDVAIDEGDAALLTPGSPAAVKLEGFPTSIFRGPVVIVSPKMQTDQEHRYAFRARGDPEQGRECASGHARARQVNTGLRPAGTCCSGAPRCGRGERCGHGSGGKQLGTGGTDARWQRLDIDGVPGDAGVQWLQ